MNSQKSQRQRQRPKGRTGKHGPVPPPGGWDLMQAAEALLPGMVAWVWQADVDDRSSLFARLGVDLVRAIRDREDLVLSGQDIALPIHHPRVAISRAALFESRAFISLGILEGMLRIGWPPGAGRDAYFTAVRVESVNRLDKGVAGESPPPPSPTPPPPSPPPPPPCGGRRTAYDWAMVEKELLAKLSEDGAPAPWDGGQAELERFVAGLFPEGKGKCPSESRIRVWVKRTIDKYRRALA